MKNEVEISELDNKLPELLNDFNEDDLIYGLNALSTGGNSARHQFVNLIQKHKKEMGHYITVDRINNILLMLVLNPNKPLELSESIPVIDKKKIQDHWDFLKNFKSKKNFKRYDFENMRNYDEDKIKMKLCKAALFRGKGIVRFCLDNIDIKRVAEHTQYNSRQNKYCIDKSFTAAEIRFIFNHWNELRDKVFFYENGKKTNAPWEQPSKHYLTWEENYRNSTQAKAYIKEQNEIIQTQNKLPSNIQQVHRKRKLDFENNVNTYKNLTGLLKAPDSITKEHGFNEIDQPKISINQIEKENSTPPETKKIKTTTVVLPIPAEIHNEHANEAYYFKKSN